MKTTKFFLGSEWRKWDLHVHSPFTKLSNAYVASAGREVWDEFCETIEQSDISCIGITDYFSIDNYCTFLEKFKAKFPDSQKVFFPNIEFRLEVSVNQKLENVNIHVIFSPTIDVVKIRSFLSKLRTNKTRNGAKIFCSELAANEYVSASVLYTDIPVVLKEVFGNEECYFIVCAANNDGLRADSKSPRKMCINDEIDKVSHGFFGGSQNVSYFLNEDRYEDGEKAKQKPVIGGSDAHSFEELQQYLGKRMIRTTDGKQEIHKDITWVKADPTFEGLQQIFIEPESRVYIGATKPDEKEPYKVIRKILFSDTSDFPAEIEFGDNLDSIIGSSSSAKSALLNYIAHAVDKTGTEQKLRAIHLDGPAANKAWSDIQFKYTVEWADGSINDQGKVIFIPQSYLFGLSNKPQEITEKIKPVLFGKFPTIEAEFKSTQNATVSSNEIITDAIQRWFTLMNQQDSVKQAIKNIGDKSVIEKAKGEYQKKIDEIKATLSLNEEEIVKYQEVSRQVAEKTAQIKVLTAEKSNLQIQYIQDDGEVRSIDAAVTFSPSMDYLPSELKILVDTHIEQGKSAIVDKIKETIKAHKISIETKIADISTALDKVLSDNKALIQKNEQNEQLKKILDDLNRQQSLLDEIKRQEGELVLIAEKLKKEVDLVKENATSKQEAYEKLQKSFSALEQNDYVITFGIENGVNDQMLLQLSECFDLRERKHGYLLEDGRADIAKIRNAEAFLPDLYNNVITLKNHQDKTSVAAKAMCFTEEIRFNATMEGYKIGGFAVSSMTPGKQALFALTLMLDESNDTWPLLIDQPEDALDSRAIYNHIVPYLKKTKKQRQIIMVSHDANMVVGADSEQIIVANRHGDDRKNKDDQLFDYCSGSLENTQEKDTTNQHVLVV